MSAGPPRTRWDAIERSLVWAIAAHSVAVAVALVAFTRWATGFGGWGEATPLFFARQGGIFHLVVAIGYVAEYARHRTVRLLLVAKTTAVVFLAACWLGGEQAWAVPFSALGDGAMGVAVALAHRARRAEAPA